MQCDSEWRDFFLLLCECVAIDPSTVRLDGGFRQLFDSDSTHFTFFLLHHFSN